MLELPSHRLEIPGSSILSEVISRLLKTSKKWKIRAGCKASFELAAVCSNLLLETAELEMEAADGSQQHIQARALAAMPLQCGFVCGLDGVFAFSTQ